MNSFEIEVCFVSGEFLVLAELSDYPETILITCKQCYEKALEIVYAVTGRKQTKSSGPNSPLNLTKQGIYLSQQF